MFIGFLRRRSFSVPRAGRFRRIDSRHNCRGPTPRIIIYKKILSHSLSMSKWQGVVFPIGRPRRRPTSVVYLGSPPLAPSSRRVGVGTTPGRCASSERHATTFLSPGREIISRQFSSTLSPSLFHPARAISSLSNTNMKIGSPSPSSVPAVGVVGSSPTSDGGPPTGAFSNSAAVSSTATRPPAQQGSFVPLPPVSYEDFCDRLFRQNMFTMKLGLENMQRALALEGLPHMQVVGLFLRL